MVTTAAELEQLRGVGRVLSKRLMDAGFDSFAKIAQADQETLGRVRGLAPRNLKGIIEQARQLQDQGEPDQTRGPAEMKRRYDEVAEQVRNLALQTRERYRDKLSGKSGKKMTSDLVRMEKALQRIQEGVDKGSKRSDKALVKAQKRVTGLEEASIKKVHKGLKRARKAVLRAVK